MMKNYVCSGRKICKLSEKYLGEGWCSYCTPLSPPFYNEAFDILDIWGNDKKFCNVINQDVKSVCVDVNKQLKLF